VWIVRATADDSGHTASVGGQSTGDKIGALCTVGLCTWEKPLGNWAVLPDGECRRDCEYVIVGLPVWLISLRTLHLMCLRSASNNYNSGALAMPIPPGINSSKKPVFGLEVLFLKHERTVGKCEHSAAPALR
jgi:hypothetical protein